MPVAGLLAREIQLRFGDDAVHYDVAVDAHLLAAEMEYEFALHYCKSRGGGPVWEKDDEWTASLEDESEESAVRLDRAEPLDATVESAADQLTEFLMELDEPTSVRASTEAMPDALAAVLRRRGGLAAPPPPGIAKVGASVGRRDCDVPCPPRR